MSVQQEKFKEIADAIREKTNSTEKIKPSEFAGKVDEVYEAGKTKGIEEGKKAEHDAWWEVYQQGGNPMNITNLFAYDPWTDEIYKPIYTIRSSSANLNYIYYSSKITDTIVDIDARDKTLIETFSYAGQLKTIRKLIVNENTKYTTPFRGLGNLVNFVVEGEIGQNGFDLLSCAKLSYDSLVSIMNALKDFSGSGTTHTITLTSTSKQLLNEQGNKIAEAQAKGWTVA